MIFKHTYDIPIQPYFKNKVDLKIVTNDDLISEAQTREDGLDSLMEELPTKIVSVDKIVPTQEGIHSYRLKDAHEYKGDLPLLVKINGLYYIEDGHHRIVSCIIGNVPVKAKIYDYKRRALLNGY